MAPKQAIQIHEDDSEPRRRPYQELHPSIRAFGVALYKKAHFTLEEVAAILDTPKSTVSDVIRKAEKRANKSELGLLDPRVYEDAPRSGRPPKLSPQQREELVDQITTDTQTREENSRQISNKLYQRISHTYINELMSSFGYSRTKKTWKTDLTAAQKQKRYEFAIAYHPDSFDWRRVVYTDETPIYTGLRKGNNRIWRQPGEKYHKDCIAKKPNKKPRALQFWAAFTYEYKGPCHVFYQETEQEKTLAATLLAIENEARKTNKRSMDIAQKALRELDPNTAHGPAPTARKLLKRGDRTRGGVDGYRHREDVLKPKLLPWLQELQNKHGIQPIVLEDNAPAHRSKFDSEFFSFHSIQKLLYPGYCPESNAIEHAWPWVREKVSTNHPQSKTQQEAARYWAAEWSNLPQDLINKWIDHIPIVIMRIIEQQGGNHFHG